MKQAACLAVMAMGTVVAEEKYAFAFEVVRHGARNTYVDGYTSGFPVGNGMLTPEGMR